MNIVWIHIAVGIILGAGLALGNKLWIEPYSAALSLFGAGLSLCLSGMSRLKLACLFTFMALYGFSAVQIAQQHFQSVSWRAHGKVIVLAGEVQTFPEKIGKSLRWSMNVSSFRMEESEWMRTQSRAEVFVPAQEEPPLIGDRLVLKGRVYFKEPGNLGWERWSQILFLKGVQSQVRVKTEGNFIFEDWNFRQFPLRLIQLLRESLELRINAVYSEQQASILKALLLGMRVDDAALRQTFNRTGTSHLLSVSGFHAAVVAGFIFAAAIWLRLLPTQAVFFAAGGILIYMGLTGWGVAVQRAGMMAVLVWAAWAMGRPQPLHYWLNVALAGMLMLEPKRIGDVSFQLSFLSMYGIVFVAPLLRPFLRLLGLDVSAAAFFASYPAVLFHFQSWAWIGILANLLAVPAFALILPLGYFSLIPAVGAPALYAVRVLLESCLFSIRIFAEPSWACLSAAQPSLFAIYAYYLAGGVCLYLLKPKNMRSVSAAYSGF